MKGQVTISCSWFLLCCRCKACTHRRPDWPPALHTRGHLQWASRALLKGKSLSPSFSTETWSWWPLVWKDFKDKIRPLTTWYVYPLAKSSDQTCHCAPLVWDRPRLLVHLLIVSSPAPAASWQKKDFCMVKLLILSKSGKTSRWGPM